MYQKEYGLSEDQVKVIYEISDTGFSDTSDLTTQSPNEFPSSKKIKAVFEKDNKNNTYIGKIETNYKYLNVSIFKK
jgi:hypothetical protein